VTGRLVFVEPVGLLALAAMTLGLYMREMRGE